MLEQPPEDITPENLPVELIDRLTDVRDTIEKRVIGIQEQLAQHYRWRDRLENERDALSNVEEKATQNEMIAVVQERIRRFDKQIETCRHEMSLLRTYGALAIENKGANTADLGRILEKYEASPEYDPTARPRGRGLESLPYFVRPGETSGIARFPRMSPFEIIAHRGKVLLKAAVIMGVLVFVARGVGGGLDGNSAGGAKFGRPGAGGGSLVQVTGGGSVDGGFSGPARILTKMVSSLSGVDVGDLAADTAQTLKSVRPSAID